MCAWDRTSNLPRVEILEGQLPGEQLPQHNAKSVNVRRWTVRLHSLLLVSALHVKRCTSTCSSTAQPVVNQAQLFSHSHSSTILSYAMRCDERFSLALIEMATVCVQRTCEVMTSGASQRGLLAVRRLEAVASGSATRLRSKSPTCARHADIRNCADYHKFPIHIDTHD